MDAVEAHHYLDVTVTRHFRDLSGRLVIGCGSSLSLTTFWPDRVSELTTLQVIMYFCLTLSLSLSLSDGRLVCPSFFCLHTPTHRPPPIIFVCLPVYVCVSPSLSLFLWSGFSKEKGFFSKAVWARRAKNGLRQKHNTVTATEREREKDPKRKTLRRICSNCFILFSCHYFLHAYSVVVVLVIRCTAHFHFFFFFSSD